MLFRSPLRKDYLRFEVSRFQVLRTPVCDVLTVSNPPLVVPWNGEVGGILVLLGNVVYVDAPLLWDGAGFRGGLSYPSFQASVGDTSLQDFSDIDFTYLPLNARKGEGIEGTPNGFALAGTYSRLGGCARGFVASAGGGGNQDGGPQGSSGGGGAGYGEGSNGISSFAGLGGIPPPQLLTNPLEMIHLGKPLTNPC